MNIRFGPAGLGKVKEAIDNLNEFHNLGLRACEIAFTYGVYIKDIKDARLIGNHAKKLDIKLSIHAPYWINLNSKEKIKVEQSKQRILDCCKIGEELGAEIVVFHPGYYAGMSQEQTYNNIKNAILDIKKIIQKNKWKINIAPETMGKINVFGSFQQISDLAKETNSRFCIDFAHIEARDKKIDYERIKYAFSKFKDWHVHFSGIEYTKAGEKRHIRTPKEKIKELLKNLPKDKNIVIINESPNMIEDSVESLNIFNSIKNKIVQKITFKRKKT
ncbi:MAG: TIM barrel protein [Candidatus Pacearchaeota archaeon]